MKWSYQKMENSCIIDLPNNVFHREIIESLKELLKDLSDSGYSVFFLNMGQIARVCSEGLACIINIYKFADEYDMEVRLYNLQPCVSQMIYQTRLNQVFHINSSANCLLTA